MTVVELVVSEAKIWARGTTTHWDVPPSIVLGSNGSDLVVGEPLTPPTQVVSAVQYLAGDRIALPPRMPTLDQALSAVLGAIMDTLRVAVPCERLVVVHPTAWGPRALDLFATAAARFAHEIVFETCAVRASDVDEATRRSRRTAVVEFGMLSTTVSSVGYDAEGTHVEAVEVEPTLAAAELDGAEGWRLFDELLARLLADRPADVVQVFGTTDPKVLEAVTSAVENVCGATVPVSPLTGTDLARPAAPTSAYTPSIPPPAAEWMQPLRERAAATKPVDHRPLYVGAAALAAVIAAAAVGGFFFLGSSGDQQAAATVETSTATSASATAPPTSKPAPRPSTEAIGRVVVEVPVGWHRSSTADPTTRADLVPDDATRHRITITQKPVTPGAGYDDVAADLAAQIAEKPAGTVTEVRRDVVFAGRPGLAYEEHPADGSTVRWQVLVERGVQVSIGCQYLDNGWPALTPTCEQVVGAVQVGR
ncbi:type VII secretion-associated protein [Nocardia mangyaensis]|uniref:Type VII secretion-associated protein n=1 Tax=Nocardia mangyaensis TaxID=2213200 RepID=A0A1J0VMP1_9NOCA|nr:type VII secretion-associated protein [Nocardia mangyaensis]APE33297.1 type VII secretion-associated protein [Nocardia mangyaensis]